jgi:hypothetical protein
MIAAGTHRLSCGTGAPQGANPLQPDDAIVVVMRLRGQSPGPTLLVCGREAVCRPIFGQIMRLPSLPWLSGTLLLGYVGEFQAAQPQPENPPKTGDEPSFDDALFLEYAGEGDAAPRSYRRKAYWTILRKMAAIGMISGRGVPQS